MPVVYAVPMLSARVRWSVLAAAIVISFGIKLALALSTYGTNDILTWEKSAAKIAAHDELRLYREGNRFGQRRQVFNHPPFMLRVIHAWDQLAGISGLPLRFWMRITSSLADVASVLLVSIILSRGGGPALPAIVAMALAPASILISGFHGNSDPVMVLFILLAIFFIECRGAWILAGAAFGLALCIKVVPVILLPAFLFYLPTWRARWNFTLSVTLVVFVLSLPILLQDPVTIVTSVLGYSHQGHNWGLGRILLRLAEKNASWQVLSDAYSSQGKFILLPAIAALGFWMNSLSVKPRLFTQCGIIFFFFLALTPNFGVQYLAWLIPWAAAFGPLSMLSFHLCTGMFLFGAYNYWSGGIPWYYADSMNFGPWPWRVKIFELLCWAMVSCITLMLLRQVIRSRKTGGKSTDDRDLENLPAIGNSGISPRQGA